MKKKESIREAKNYYITNPNTSLRKTADKFGLSLTTLKKFSSQEKWREERIAFSESLRLKTREKLLESSLFEKDDSYARKLVKDSVLKILEHSNASLHQMDPCDTVSISRIMGTIKEANGVLGLKFGETEAPQYTILMGEEAARLGG